MARVSLFTFAYCYCLFIASMRVDANQWCYCDRDLCTTTHYSIPDWRRYSHYSALREVCPDKLPDWLVEKIAAKFKDTREMKNASSLLTVMGTMMEKGFDQKSIASMMDGVDTKDMTTLANAMGFNGSMDWNSILAEMDKPTVEYVLTTVTDLLRNNRVEMNKTFDEMLNKTISALKDHVGMTKHELELFNRYIIKDKSQLPNFLSSRVLNHFRDQRESERYNDIKKMVDSFVDQKYSLPLYKNYTQAEMGQKTRELKLHLTEEGFPQTDIKHFLKLAAIYGNHIDTFLRSKLVLARMNKFIMEHQGSNETEEEVIIKFLKEDTNFISNQTGRYSQYYGIGFYKTIVRSEIYARMTKKRGDIVLANGNVNNLLQFRTIQRTWRFQATHNPKQMTQFIKNELDKLPNISEPLAKLVKVIAPEVKDLIKQISSRTNMKRIPPEPKVEQFCLKVVVGRDNTFRICGHLAAQFTQFNFREGCHFETILGIPDAKFCRCNSYLCNNSVTLTIANSSNILLIIIIFIVTRPILNSFMWILIN